MSFVPRTRLEKILCGLDVTPRTRTEKAVKEAMESIDSAVELPKVTTNDNGKVLKVTSGKWKKGDDNDSLPVVTAADNGKVLKVVDGAWAAVAETPAENAGSGDT